MSKFNSFPELVRKFLQDKEDDTLLGLGSTARKFGNETKYWLTGFSCSMLTSLTVAGVMGDLSWPYYLGVAATASHLSWQVCILVKSW